MDGNQPVSASGSGQACPEPPPPRAEGLRVVRWLGSGASASVWLVEDDAGAEFALKVFGPAGTGPDAEQVLLAGLAHEHLVRAWRRVSTDLGPGLLLTFAAGGSLAALVAARGPLTPGEAVTVLTPMGQVLAFLHGQAVTHGDVSPGNVLFTADGKPLLADLEAGRVAGSGRVAGTPGFRPPRAGDAGPEADVRALAALGWYALTGRVPAAAEARPPLGVLCPGVPAGLVELLEQGLEDEPALRPSAAEFARRAFRCTTAEPVDLAAAVHPSVVPRLLTRRQALPDGPRARPRRRAGQPGQGKANRWRQADPGRLLLAGTALTAAVGLAIALAGMLSGTELPQAGTAAGRSAAPPAASIPAQPAARPVPGRITEALESQDPQAALPGLAWLRTEALRTRSAGLLENVNVAGSEAMAADRAIVDALVAGDSWLTGLDTRVRDVRLVSASATGAVLSATVTTSAFQQHNAVQGMVRQVPEPKEQRLRIRLEQSGGRWLIHSILPPAAERG